MKIAIHNNPGSFSDRWIEYCKINSINYKIVNCYDTNIIDQLNDCDALMWHHNHGDYRDILFAKQLLYSLEVEGKKVFPNFNTAWHFDDKVGQKYLLESIGAPLVPSYVFYSKKEAISWASSTAFPKVFKLRSGAGSANVKLVKTRKDAVKLINKAFGKGFPPFDRIGYFRDRFNKYRSGVGSYLGVLKGAGRLIVPIANIHLQHREKGYVYFQDFLPDNNFDIRVIVVGDKAFAVKRMIRKEDFRASGSGCILYGKTEFDDRCIEIAFDINKRLLSQSIAYDFVFDEEKKPLIVEISYGFNVRAYDNCSGYWDSKLNWYPGKFNPQGWMVEHLISTF